LRNAPGAANFPALIPSHMTKFLLIAGACAVLLLPGCASVPTTNAEANAQTVDKYQKWSSSGDGKISFADFNKNIAEDNFSFYDKNKDGVIDKSEWAAVRGAGAAANKLFAQVDTAHNGKITLAEFTNNKTLVADRKASFNALDKGHKGYLGSKDIVSYFAKRSAF
jgi:Ca2+-binding EF-hand superfamily protein